MEVAQRQQPQPRREARQSSLSRVAPVMSSPLVGSARASWWDQHAVGSARPSWWDQQAVGSARASWWDPQAVQQSQRLAADDKDASIVGEDGRRPVLLGSKKPFWGRVLLPPMGLRMRFEFIFEDVLGVS